LVSTSAVDIWLAEPAVAPLAPALEPDVWPGVVADELEPVEPPALMPDELELESPEVVPDVMPELVLGGLELWSELLLSALAA
jgi:hypothetical protein